jgi:CubicO group peptidase (beta-lactamase class C family)
MVGVGCYVEPLAEEHAASPMVTEPRSDAGEADAQGARTPLPAAVPSCTTDVSAELARLAVPGLAAGIVKNGRLVCTAVAGSANIEEKRPVTPDTVFAWASTSKTITGVTLMTLFDEGKFELDDDINAHLPFQVKVPSCPSKPITFRQLLTHTSSIIEDDDGPYGDSYTQGDSPVVLGDFLKKYLVAGGAHYDATANFVKGCPGTTNEYSNVGAGLIGYVAEAMAKTPFDKLAEARVFKPLGMNETSFRLASFDLSHVAMPYERSGATFKAAGHLGFATYPDGLMRTSVPQLARFLLMFMQHGELEGTRVLARATVEEMRRPQIPTLDAAQGLIWFQQDFGGRTTIGHDGSDPGTSSNMFFDPTDGAGVLLVANGEWNESAAATLMEKLFAESKGY